MTNLLNIAIPDSLISKLGWLLIIIASMNMLVNLSVMVYGSIKETRMKCRHSSTAKKYIKKFKERESKRKGLMNKYKL
jgi:hypothetical protein